MLRGSGAHFSLLNFVLFYEFKKIRLFILLLRDPKNISVFSYYD